MYNTKSKPHHKLEISVNNISVGSSVNNKCTTLVKMLILRETVCRGEREYEWVLTVHKNALEKKLCNVSRTVAMQSVVGC